MSENNTKNTASSDVMNNPDIFRLDAITEVSRETSISHVASSDVDTSVASDVRMTSLLGPSTAANAKTEESFEFAPKTTVIEEPANVEESPSAKSSVVVETVQESFDAKDVDVESGAVDTVVAESTILASPQKKTGKPTPSPSSFLEIPPATPSPVKKTSTTTTVSPTQTEPLSPEKDIMVQDEPKGDVDVTSNRRRCRRTRIILIGSIVLVVAALVGIVVAVTSGGGSNDSTSAANTPKQPTIVTPGTSVQPPIATNTPPTTVSPPGTTTTATTTATTVPPPVTTGTPSLSPTSSAPTSFPTFTLTNGPTISPTVLPTTAASPTMAPTSTLSILLPILETMTPRAILEDPTTVQGQAAVWLAYSFPIDSSFTSALTQRYAVSVLDRATNGGPPRVSDAAVVDTCDWTGISCVNGTVTMLNWANSNLTGTIPNEIAALSNLQTLDLGENELTGSLPTGLFACTELEYLYLHQNRLSGSLSENFANLPHLVNLYLGNNLFTGSLPQAFGSPNPRNTVDMRPLRYLSVHDNDLTGPIPEFWNLRFLFYLDLSHNRLTGNIPSDWSEPPSSLNRVKVVYLDHNELSGTVPSSLTSMGNGRMELLHLNDNLLTGIMPGNFDPVSFISSLEIQNNDFVSMDSSVCNSLVFGTAAGEITNFHADCDICTCSFFCGPNMCFF